MTETERMKDSIKSFDVFEFKNEDELADMTVKKCAPKFGYPNALDVSTTEIQSKGVDIGICGGADADIDYNHDAAGSFTPIETEDFAKEMPELTHVLHNDFKSHEHEAEIKPKIIESGSVFATAECCSSPGAAARLEDDLNVALQQPLCNDRSDADESLSERSPSAIANNNASFDGPSSGNCPSEWNLGDERVGIVFYPDYIDYCGTHYLDSVVNFSRSFVEARSKTMCGNERTFQIHLEIEDIVKIESKWSARYEAGIINIHFISKDGVQDDIIYNASDLAGDRWTSYLLLLYTASRLQELKFPAVDSNWYQKQEAIGSLDVRYKALWNVLLEFDKPFEEVIYPKGDPDAVSISKRDVDLLLPDTFVNDTIIDFYIKYLKSRQMVEERTKFHFFNSFFFRKLADMDKDPSSAFDGKAAFQHAEDGKSIRVPCIMHMDSLRGNHAGLKDLIQSYLWEEWKERLKETSEDLYSNFRNLKFIPLELPQQQNSYDCGLFLLHYVELFLEEVPTNFSIYQIASSSKFLQPDWFPPGEASMKRTRIEKLINDLLDTQSEDCPPFGGSGMNCPPEGLNATHGYDNSCPESSIRQIDQGIEMTLLPDSSTRSMQCNRTSGLVLKELFKQASAPEPFHDASWGALGNKASIHEFKRPVILTEEEVEANECFAQQGLAESVFQHIDDGVTLDEPNFPYSSGDFRLNPLHQPTSDDVDSSPVTSGSDSDSDDIVEVEADDENWQSVELDNHRCPSPEKIEQWTVGSAFPSGEMLNAEKSGTLAQIKYSDDNSSSLKEFRQEANQSHNHDPSHEGLGLGVGPTVLESVITNDEAHST
ncbi:probable ubiquitin-like-specific protease 2b [Phtheirospermum japonicum]|uniref:Probable ubiquitin-like-specific protease 2b n=1 Tax=Phtheirospermum japonicum TaxID=374723 RepID=A0A830BZB1_9LAMI|nr:probable ubiquitin-like-specific protease 2b [Phtheirospermum japonicum]